MALNGRLPNVKGSPLLVFFYSLFLLAQSRQFSVTRVTNFWYKIIQVPLSRIKLLFQSRLYQVWHFENRRERNLLLFFFVVFRQSHNLFFSLSSFVVVFNFKINEQKVFFFRFEFFSSIFFSNTAVLWLLFFLFYVKFIYWWKV